MAEEAADTARTELSTCGIGTPHATTLARVFERLDSDAFDLLAGDWDQTQGRPVAIAVDGKEMRGAKNDKGSRVHLLAAIDHDTHAVLGQVTVGEKSNEIPQFPVLMDHFPSLSGVVITADAYPSRPRTLPGRTRGTLHFHRKSDPANAARAAFLRPVGPYSRT